MKYLPIAIALFGMLSSGTLAVSVPTHGLRILTVMGVMANAYVLGWCVRALPR